MPTTYCSSCGHKMDYTLKKPNFCTECGQSLGTFQKTERPVQAEPETKEEDIENYDPDGSDVFSVPKLSRLEYEIEHDRDGSFSLGSIMPEPEPQKKPKKRGRPRKKS